MNLKLNHYEIKKKSQYTESALDQLRKVMHAGNYVPLSFINYARQLEFLFSYYPDKRPSQLAVKN